MDDKMNYFNTEKKKDYATIFKYDNFKTPEDVQLVFDLTDEELIEYWQYSRIDRMMPCDGDVFKEILLQWTFKKDSDGEDVANAWLKEKIKWMDREKKKEEKIIKKLQEKMGTVSIE